MNERREIKEEREGGGESADWVPRHWRRWMRVVFAPWARGVGNGERGVEFEIWTGGVRAIQIAKIGEEAQGGGVGVSGAK